MLLSDMDRGRTYSLVLLKAVFIALLQAPTFSPATATYWALNLATIAATEGESGVCNRSALTQSQYLQCLSNRDTVYSTALGVELGIAQCRRVFVNNRWNCSATGPHERSFADATSRGTPETAFVQAILSAGMMSLVSRYCKEGRLLRCSCDQTVRSPPTDGSFLWSGCGDNYEYGYYFSQRFSNSAYQLTDTSGGEGGQEISDYELMAQHNAEVGRLVVKSNLQVQCRCFGLSGTCSIKICHAALPNFDLVGQKLYGSYGNAKKVVRSSGTPVLTPVDSRTPLGQTDLVYLLDPPSYCDRDDRYGSLGTQGRYCKVDSVGVDSCGHLCCGRGYRVEYLEVPELCNCRLTDCPNSCRFRCDTCNKLEPHFFCN
uniref:Protein Wnt n=1 Tax=Halisarca dujardinii TaxID=2583056 RepID=A0A175C7A9_HALDU